MNFTALVNLKKSDIPRPPFVGLTGRLGFAHVRGNFAHFVLGHLKDLLLVLLRKRRNLRRGIDGHGARVHRSDEFGRAAFSDLFRGCVRLPAFESGGFRSNVAGLFRPYSNVANPPRFLWTVGLAVLFDGFADGRAFGRRELLAKLVLGGLAGEYGLEVDDDAGNLLPFELFARQQTAPAVNEDV
jgi:hypothetical protein